MKAISFATHCEKLYSFIVVRVDTQTKHFENEMSFQLLASCASLAFISVCNFDSVNCLGVQVGDADVRGVMIR